MAVAISAVASESQKVTTVVTDSEIETQKEMALYDKISLIIFIQ